MKNDHITPNDIRHIFSKTFNGQPNFMTPEVVRFGKVRNSNLIYELSTGRGIMPDTKIFGVTILTISGEKKENLSSSFSTKEKAEVYINSITSEDETK